MNFVNKTNNTVRVYEDLKWAEFTRDGQLIRKNKEVPFAEAWTEKELMEVAEKIRQFPSAPYPDVVYLRFNKPPKSGKSCNHATGKLEKGVSCYALTWDLVSGCYKRTGGGLDGAMYSYMIQGSPVYLITGKECGIGSDGEPLLEKVKVLARAKLDAEKGGWSVSQSEKEKKKEGKADPEKEGEEKQPLKDQIEAAQKQAQAKNESIAAEKVQQKEKQAIRNNRDR